MSISPTKVTEPQLDKEPQPNKEPQLGEERYARVAVPVPLRQTFDFIVPATHQAASNDLIGRRVFVPFGARKMVGVITSCSQSTSVDPAKLKPILSVLDRAPLFDSALWTTLQWISSYYLAPIGEVFEMALPTLLRQAQGAEPATTRQWVMSEAGRMKPIEELNRAPLQLAIIKRLLKRNALSADDFGDMNSGWRAAVNTLIDKGWVDEQEVEPQLVDQADSFDTTVSAPVPIELNTAQQGATQELIKKLQAQTFSVSLLLGVTGSGKTEVYFAAIQAALDAQQQALVLVPEIGLTPQLLERFQIRFKVPITVMHSNLSDKQRHLAWWHAKTGQARIVIGTRSAVLCTLPELGLIVVDEEHDGSFKQQDGVRYHARDTAIYRAKCANVPIVLGSATPALESYYNALEQRYTLLELPSRASAALLPDIQLVDLEKQASSDGITPTLSAQLRATFKAGEQSMLFINRRGFAPVMYCIDCKSAVRCHRCDAHLTVHRAHNRLRCHHCGYETRIPLACPKCQSNQMTDLGEGTQRVETTVQSLLPNANIARIDRDSTRNKGQLEAQLDSVKSGQADVVVGTQLLTKGHDFAHLCLVGVLDADQGLYSSDFRSTESLFQQLVQVAGRAGRRDQQGRVLIQTRFCEHPLFKFIIAQDFAGFARAELQTRQQLNLPPFSFLAMLRAESTHDARAMQFLRTVKSQLSSIDEVRVMDPVAAPMAKRAGRYRAQLLIQSSERRALHNLLAQLIERLEQDDRLRKLSANVRWSLDVDPQDLY